MNIGDLLDAYRDAMEACIGDELHNADPTLLDDEVLPDDVITAAHAKELAARQRIEAAFAELTQALTELVRCNEEWNAVAGAIVGRPVGWSDSYLDKARAAIKSQLERKAEGE